jgi:hypothetical protein
MATDCIATLPARAATIGGELVPTPSRRINLKTLAQVRREMAFVYREMRAGSIESQDGTRYVYVLAQVGKMIVETELERRVARLEAKHGP